MVTQATVKSDAKPITTASIDAMIAVLDAELAVLRVERAKVRAELLALVGAEGGGAEEKA